MKTYNCKVYFKIKDTDAFRYVMCFEIEAFNNAEAKSIAETKWIVVKDERPHLKNAHIVKIQCRAKETKPRARMVKLTPLQKALSALNDYINEDLNK